MKSIASKNGMIAIFLIAILVAFVGVTVAPSNVAYAVLPDDYCDYIASLDENDAKDWYFGEDYLNISEVLEVINSWKTNPDFDLNAIKENPVVIAVIDSGIGHAYYEDAKGNETEAQKNEFYNTVDGNGNVLSYYVNPIFDDVILTDNDGNYVYKSVVNKNVRGKKVCATLDGSINDMAYVLADNTDDNHGTHVTGTVALLIHALELEEYVKILPIKANDSVKKVTGTTKYTAHYEYDDVEKAIKFAQENGASIISLSLTANKSSFSFDEYSDELLICAAAGNNSSNSTLSPGYPAASDKVLGVMNYTFGDDGAVISEKSNYGTKYDVAAPGSNIISTIDGKDGYGVLSGTSMATPIVAVAAAIASIRYNAMVDTDLVVTPEIVRKMITLSAGETKGAKRMPMLDLLSLITTDFQSENEDDIFVDAEDISVDGPATTEYTLKDLSEITLYAKSYPNNSRVNGEIEWWYECGGQKTDLGKGAKISFALPAIVGTYAVYCRVVDGSGNVSFSCSPEDAYVCTVNYLTLKFDEIRIVSTDGKVPESDLYEHEPRTFAIKDIEYAAPYQYSVVWFVDGEMVKGATGNNFEFITKEVGKHKVSARVNGTYVYDVEFEVLANPEVNEKLPSYIIVVVIISAIAAVSCVVLGVAYVLKKRKINEK